MRYADFKLFGKYLSRNKLYSFINVFGFSISLMFIILLGVYVKQELSVDSFHKNKDRIYLYAGSSAKDGELATTICNPAPESIKNLLPEVESYCRVVSLIRTIKAVSNEQIQAKMLFADSSFFSMFSFKLLEGDPTTVLSSNNSAVLTRSFANKLFGKENFVGKTFEMQGRTITVTGVVDDFPQNTQFPQCDMVASYSLIGMNWGENILTNWGNCSFTSYFLVKDGANIHAKEGILLDDFKKNFWLFRDGFYSNLSFVPLEEAYFAPIYSGNFDLKHNSRTQITVYLAIAILILVVSILNYINMSVSQAGYRGKEVAMKKLLGCSKARLVKQLLLEATLLSLIAFSLGLLLAFFVEPFFNSILNTQLGLASCFSSVVVGSCILGVLLVGIISGAIPAAMITRFEPIEVVRGTFSRRFKTVYSKVLITFQYVVVSGLLMGSIFIMLQVDYLKNFDLGFNRERILIMENVLESTQLAGFKDKLKALSGVEAVSFVQGSPFDGGNNHSFTYKGESLSFQTFIVDSAFFDVFNIHIQPTGITSTEQTWYVNQIGYNALMPDSISHQAIGENGFEMQIAGITNNFHFRSLYTPISPSRIRVLKEVRNPWAIAVRINAATDIVAAIKEIKGTYSRYNGGQPFESEFSDNIIQQWYEKEDRMAKLVATFTLLTIVILVMGIFAMSLYYIRQKEREIAIRKVNGAVEFQIMTMLNRLFSYNILLALLVAIPVVYYVITRWLEQFPYKIAVYWWVFILSAAIVLIISVLAISWQAWKAATANPIDKVKAQ